MDLNRSPDTVTRSMHDYWTLFLTEGVALVALGLLAIVIPSIANSAHCQPPIIVDAGPGRD